MKIAILVYQFPPKWLAGTEMASFHIARHLAILGHEIHVITRLDKGTAKESRMDGFYVHRLRSPSIKFLSLPMFWLRILICLYKVKPDIVHIQGITFGILIYLVKKLLKKRCLVWGRGSDVYEIGMFGVLTRWMIKVGLRNSDAVIALTQSMKIELQMICRKQVYVVPNGIDLKMFDGLMSDRVRNELRIGDYMNIILWVGNMNPWKGIEYLVEAVSILRNTDTNNILILVGSGRERNNLELLIEQLDLKDSVIFTGELPNHTVLEYMSAADIFVLPSLTEGFPNVVMEAMGAGLPIIATNIPGMSEIIVNGENGYLVEPKEPEQIADKVSLLLNDDKLRSQMSENNKSKAMQYSWQTVVQKLEEIYSKISSQI